MVRMSCMVGMSRYVASSFGKGVLVEDFLFKDAEPLARGATTIYAASIITTSNKHRGYGREGTFSFTPDF